MFGIFATSAKAQDYYGSDSSAPDYYGNCDSKQQRFDAEQRRSEQQRLDADSDRAMDLAIAHDSKANGDYEQAKQWEEKARIDGQ
jgi:hypothetical protein